MPEVEISVASLEEKGTLANLLQLYIHDFSEFWSARAEGELRDDGRFDDYSPLDSYWREPSRVPLLLRREGRLIGFALINGVSYIGRPVERNMAEFFIARKHRRSGTGTAAARGLFNLYPGAWEVAVARRNVGALAFWRGAIGGHPRVAEVEALDVATQAWNGPVFRFLVA